MRYIILLPMLFFIFFQSESVVGQNKFLLLTDDDTVIETSKRTLVQVINQEEIIRLKQFSGIKPIAGIILWEKNLSHFLSQNIIIKGDNIKKIFIKWRLTTKGKDSQITIEKISVRGDHSVTIDEKLIKDCLLSVPFEFFTKDKQDYSLNFYTIFKKGR